MRLPSDPKRGDSIRQKMIELIRYVRATTIRDVSGGALKGSPNGQVIEIPSVAKTAKGKSIKLPLDIAGLREEDGAFFVTITPGYVIERTVINAAGTDCLTYHDIDVSSEQEVGNGDAIFVKVTVQDDGTISESVISVDASDTKSTHYAPPVGDETAGAVGEYYYKLAEFEEEGDTLKIVKFMAGANIEHFQELPRFEKAGGTADVFKTFDQASGKYKTRGITGLGAITATQGTNEITIGFQGGADLKLEVLAVTLSIDFSGETFSFGGSIPIETYYWRNGIYIGQVAPDDEEYDPPVQRVHYFANANANP